MSEMFSCSVTPRATAYLSAIDHILLRDGKLTTAAIAEQMGLKADTLRKWLKAHPEVGEWVRSEVVGRRLEQVHLLFQRNFNLAMRGSIAHADWCAKVAGWYYAPEDDDTVPQGTAPAVTVLIKGPDGAWPHQPPGRPIPPPAMAPNGLEP